MKLQAWYFIRNVSIIWAECFENYFYLQNGMHLPPLHFCPLSHWLWRRHFLYLQFIEFVRTQCCPNKQSESVPQPGSKSGQ